MCAYNQWKILNIEITTEIFVSSDSLFSKFILFAQSKKNGLKEHVSFFNHQKCKLKRLNLFH